MYDRDYILSSLKKEIRKNKRYPRQGLKQGYFEARSYHNWAVDELLKWIASSDEDPMEVAIRFVNHMMQPACDAKTASSKFMFSTAVDAGQWILDILCALYEQEGVIYES